MNIKPSKEQAQQTTAELPEAVARTSMHHALKILPEYFRAVVDGTKTFEIRDNKDRGFQFGDTVTLKEYDSRKSLYTGREVTKVVGYVTDFGQKPGYVVFGISDAHQAQQTKAQNNCMECSNGDSWGLPDRPVCKSCTGNSKWEPLNASSVNPNKRAQQTTVEEPELPEPDVILDGNDEGFLSPYETMYHYWIGRNCTKFYSESKMHAFADAKVRAAMAQQSQDAAKKLADAELHIKQLERGLDKAMQGGQQ